MSVKPYGKQESKKEEVREMFDHIAPTYDLLNHTLSLNIDKIWRRKTIREAAKANPESILDVATGTGDLAIAASRLPVKEIVGIDLSSEMLRVGTDKVADKNLDSLITLLQGDSEKLPFEDERFDLVMVAFGVRNFENPQLGLSEMNRVLKSGGSLLVLEFSNPSNPVINLFYQFYFKHVLPLVGRVISKDFSAYKYLPQSVAAFPQREDFVELLTNSGFVQGKYKPLTFGISCLYSGIK